MGGWVKVLMKIFIKTSDICQESVLTKGPTNYILLVRDDHLDSSCITFRQNTFRQFIETPLLSQKDGAMRARQAKAVLKYYDSPFGDRPGLATDFEQSSNNLLRP